MAWWTARTEYSRAEVFSDTIVHVSGLTIVTIAAPLLVVMAASVRGDTPAVAGTLIYALALTANLLFSALYNTVGRWRWTGVLRRLDHSAIFIKIAASYTPFALLSPGVGPWFLPGLWLAAGLGIGFKIFAIDRTAWLSIVLCLAMGWSGLLVPGQDFLAHLSPEVMMLILIAGAIYTFGVALYLFDRLPFHYTCWHVCVLAASLIFYSAVTLEVLQSAT